MRPPLARAALALYPPSWRARYGDEVRALLDDSGGGPAAVASLAWHALPAWFCPPRHLHDRPARMRASLATALMSWSMLTGLGLVFAQLTQLQGLLRPPPRSPLGLCRLRRHPGHLGADRRPRWTAAVAADAAPGPARAAHPRHGVPAPPGASPRSRTWPADRDGRLAGGASGVSQGWFGVITLAGFAAAATAAAGPGLALRRLQPRGPALRLAAAAAGVSAAVMAVAAVAIVVAVTSLCLWARQFAGYHHGTVSAIYLALVAAAATVTTVSAARGTRAALAQP